MVAMQAASIHCGVCLQTADNDLPLLMYIRGEGERGGEGKGGVNILLMHPIAVARL